MPNSRTIALVAFSALPNALAGFQQPPALSTAVIAARATPATVTILTFGAIGDTLGQGSGFLIRASGVIVTNWHVIAGARTATVILASGERYTRVLFLDGDSTRDVALLQVPGASGSSLKLR